MWGEGRKEDGVNAAWQRQKDGHGKMGSKENEHGKMGREDGHGKMGMGRWEAWKTGMEEHGPGKVGVGKRDGEVSMG